MALYQQRPTVAFRGFGAPQALWMAESQMKKLAEKTRLGPGGSSPQRACGRVIRSMWAPQFRVASAS